MRKRIIQDDPETAAMRKFNAAMIGTLAKTPRKTTDELHDRVWFLETVKRDIDARGVDSDARLFDQNGKEIDQHKFTPHEGMPVPVRESFIDRTTPRVTDGAGRKLVFLNRKQRRLRGVKMTKQEKKS